MLDYAGLPVWAVVLKRVLTLLVLAGCGLHAHVQYKRRGVKLHHFERWLYFVFSITFLFGVVANFAAAALTAKIGDKAGGPFSNGEFALLTCVVYLIVNFWASQRRRI